jgi:hypothetical protein
MPQIKVRVDPKVLQGHTILDILQLDPWSVRVTLSNCKQYLQRAEAAVGGGVVYALYELRDSCEFCVWDWGSKQCGIDRTKLRAGEPDECNQTFEMCRDVHKNAVRFGGMPRIRGML